MKAYLLDTAIPDLLPMQGRSDGVHVTHVINRLCVALGHYEESDGPLPMTRLQLGQALEHAIAHRYALDQPDRYVQPGELQKDNMFGTPDLLDVRDDAIEEIKLTWMSTRRGIDDEKLWKYLVQVKAYCWMWETQLGRLHVCYMNGDYKFGTPGGMPTYRKWHLEFTKSELAENWMMLMRHRDP